MSLVVLAYPQITEADFNWMQHIRKTEDRQYRVVKPHVTFVFPTTKLSAGELTVHVQQVASATVRIHIELTKVIVVEDDSRKFFHAFVVPSSGYDEITALHDQLYTGELASELRADIPFMPHVGIASNESQAAMQALADKLNTTGLHIKGSLDSLVVADFDGTTVRDFKEVPLQ